DENGDQPTDIWVGSGRPLEHMLYAPKVVSWLTDTDGSDDVTVTDIMRYTFILENQGNTQLTNVSLTDNLPAGLSLSAAGTPSEGSLTTGSYPSISWTGITLEVGEIATLSLDVSIDAFGGASQTFSNQGTANSDQTSSVSTDGNGSPLDGNQPTVFQAVNSGTAAPDIDVEKRWVQTLDTDEDGLVDPTDRYRYLITISNSGSASATDVLFADAAPTNTVLAGDSVFTSQGIVLSETSADIQVNIGTLPPGGIATVSFEVSPSSSSDGDLVPNQATIVSPEVNGGLALSSDDNADDDDGLNPTQTPIHTGSGTLDAADLTKTLTATSEGASSGTNVYIGEVLTYEIEIVVPKGYVYDAAILDTLPEGLRYVSGTATLSRTFGTGLHASENPGSINAASSGSTVNLTDGTDVSIGSSRYIRLFLGDLINSDTDGTAETYTLAFQVVVSNESGIGNDAGQSLTNDGTFTYLDGINQSQTLATASDPTVTIFEPNVAISQAASSAWMLTAGGVIEYTLTITNPSGSYVSTAYDLVVTDSIPFDADEWESMSLESTSGTGTTGGITNNSDLVNGQLNIAVDSLPAGETLTLVFRATADGDPEITTETDSMNNITWVTATSLPGAQGSGNSSPGAAGAINGERTSGGDYPDSDYQYADTTTLTIYDLDFSKSILNPQAYYAIGDTITYQLSIAVPDGVTVGSNVIEDALPAGLTYITSSLTTASGNDYPAAIVTDPGTDFTRVSTSPDTLRLSLGTISNSTGTADTILMTYWAWVANDLNNQYNAGTVSGTELENQAKEQFSNPVHPDAAFTDTLNDSTSAYVGEPYISISNSITSGDANPGGTMYFSVTVSNTGSNTAYDVNVQDVATQYLENIADLTVAATTGGASGPSGFTNNNTNWESSNFDIPAGGSVTITFSAEIASDAPLGTMDPNTVTVRFSSQPGSGAPVERDSTSGGNQDDLINLNNYIAAKDPTTDLIVFPIELLDFRARWMNDLQIDAKIEWVTATELNNDFFLVERSMDGQFWLEVGKVDGAGNSQIEKTYELEDKKVGFIIPGNSVFYRLKQVDFDGKFAYSSRIELLFDKDHENLVVWPNPFEGSLQVALLGDWQAEKMTLIDGAGRIVHVHEVSQTANRQRIQIPGLESLAAGTYYLVVELVNGEKKMAKVTKAD
ncbi:MAG: isopeptide-forming domain-containing fimbrial protein, partial [Bacteroidota bacterium]